MQKILILFGLFCLFAITTNLAYSQDIGLATFQETAQVIVDKSITHNVTASITLQSTSIQEIKIPQELDQKIRDNGKINAIVLTNENHCILGVSEESCIIINVARDPNDKNFPAIQNSTRQIADSFIGELNQTFDTQAKFHSVFIQTSKNLGTAFETSGIISGEGTISAVYTMPMEDTESMYEKISAILLPKIIRDSEGFYDVAKNLSKQENSKITFSIIPTQNKSLFQLKLSVVYPDADSITLVSPLDFLKTDELKRSNYFSAGFYPLNSILQIAILSPETDNVSNIVGKIVPTQIIDGEKIPTEITNNGWVFDPQEGKIIQAKYIFGEKTSISKNELKFSLGEVDNVVKPTTNDESLIIITIISAVAIGAAIFYLKGYKK